MTFPAFGTPNFVTESRGHYFSGLKIDIFGIFCQFWRSFRAPKVTKTVSDNSEIIRDVIWTQKFQKFSKNNEFLVFLFLKIYF